MKPSNPKRQALEARVPLVEAIAAALADKVRYERNVFEGERESYAPLSDMILDGLQLVQLAAAFDGYDFDFTPENEPHFHRFFVHLFALALCPLIADGHDVAAATEEAKAVLRRHRDEERDRHADEDSRFIVPTFGSGNFDDL